MTGGSNVLGLLDNLFIVIARERGGIVSGRRLLFGLDGDGGQWCLAKKGNAEVEVGQGSGNECLQENVDNDNVVEVGRVELVSVRREDESEELLSQEKVSVDPSLCTLQHHAQIARHGPHL